MCFILTFLRFKVNNTLTYESYCVIINSNTVLLEEVGMSLIVKTEDLQRFVGGQIEIQNVGERYLYRGEILGIKVENGGLTVETKWMAKGEGFPPIPEMWVVADMQSYEASLDIYTVSNIGPSGGDVGGSDRLCFNSSIIGEITILFPPDGSKIDPSKVEGLEISN
jgi:hypothetical protein